MSELAVYSNRPCAIRRIVTNQVKTHLTLPQRVSPEASLYLTSQQNIFHDHKN